MSRPLLLDLFCGAGGAAMGYHRAGFNVVGVDIHEQARYPFGFIQHDAVAFCKTLRAWQYEPLWGRIAAIHASPPCQAFSVATRDKSQHVNLIPAVRDELRLSGLPYVIENVPGAPLIDPVVICGSGLGLKVRRHRLFESNIALMVPPCVHGLQGTPVGVYGEGSSRGQVRGRKADNEAEVLAVMEMPWADRKGATQAVPPIYTELIGAQLLAALDSPLLPVDFSLTNPAK